MDSASAETLAGEAAQPEVDVDVDPETRAAVAARYRDTFPRLRAYAQRLCGRTDDAHDLAQQAVLSVLNGRRKWNRAKQPDYLRFMCGVIASTWANDCLASRANKRRGQRADDVDPDAVPNSTMNPEKLSIARSDADELHAIAARVRELLTGDAPALALLAVVLGEETVDPHAAGGPKEADLARRRLRYAAEKAVKERSKS